MAGEILLLIVSVWANPPYVSPRTKEGFKGSRQIQCVAVKNSNLTAHAQIPKSHDQTSLPPLPQIQGKSKVSAE